MVVACRQFQVHARDFHVLVRVLDPNVREGDLAIHDGQVQFTGKGNLGPLVPASILRLRFAELPERGVVMGLLGLYEIGVGRLVLWHQTMPSQETLSLFGKCQDVLRFFLEGTRATSLQEALPHQIAEITVHSGAVAGVAEVREVFDCYDAKPTYIGESVDLRWPE